MKKVSIGCSLAILLYFSLTAWQTPAPENVQLPTVTIGKQTWMATNLNVETFRNGDPIPQVTSKSEWRKAAMEGKPAWCYYNNDPATGAVHGKLYNWFAVNDPRGLAPEGWHIPSSAEWLQLIDHCGGKQTAGAYLKSSSGWQKNGHGTNNNGFNGAPGGARSTELFSGKEGFQGMGTVVYWWSSTIDRNTDVFACSLLFKDQKASTLLMDRNDGLYVRCVKD